MKTAVWVALLAAAAFAVGSVNPALLIAKALGKDIRAAGSGNPGATNAGRVLGHWWGVLVGALDIAKGFVPAYVAHALWGEHAAYVAGVAAVLGHVYSPYLKGRGGRGVATALGAVLGVHPLYAVAMLSVFAVVLVVSRWVGLASMSAAVGLVGIGVLNAMGRLRGDSGTALWAIGFGTIIIIRHIPHVRDRLRVRRAERSG